VTEIRPATIVGFAGNILRHKELNNGIYKTQEKEPTPRVGP
jgi:hypothetical protein